MESADNNITDSLLKRSDRIDLDRLSNRSYWNFDSYVRYCTGSVRRSDARVSWALDLFHPSTVRTLYNKVAVVTRWVIFLSWCILRGHMESKQINGGKERHNLSFHCGNSIPPVSLSFSVSCPLFTPWSLHLPLCSTSAPLPLCSLLLLVISSPFWFPSALHPSRRAPPYSRWPPNWNISERGRHTGKCYFRGNSSGGRAAPVGSSPASWAVSGIKLQTTRR